MPKHQDILVQIEKVIGRTADPERKELLALIMKMVDRIGSLEGQVQSLESVLNLDKTANVQAAFGLSENLAQLLIMLSDGKPKNKSALHAALYYDRPDIDAPEVKIVDTLLCKLRKYTDQHGIEISTVWGAGYQITGGVDVVLTAIEQGRIAA